MRGSPPRFRTLMQSMWKPWDRLWLFEVARNARCIWVRVGGVWMDEGGRWRTDPDAPEVVDWELMVSRHKPRSGAVAFAWLTTRTKTASLDGQTTGYGRTAPGLRRCRSWRSQERNALRVGIMLRDLWARTSLEICVHGEDLSARWVLGSAFRPSLLLLDNPVVTLREAGTKWAEPLRAPGWVRRSAWIMRERHRLWLAPADPADWLGGDLEETGTHAVWRGIRLPAPRPITDLVATQIARKLSRPGSGPPGVRDARPAP